MTVSNVTAQLRHEWYDKSVGGDMAAVPMSEALTAEREGFADSQDDIRYQAALSEGWPVSAFAPSSALRARALQDGMKTVSTASSIKLPTGESHKRGFQLLRENGGLSVNGKFKNWVRANAESLRSVMWLIVGFGVIAFIMSHDLPLGGGYLGR
jgi:hypothetical protein